MSSYTNTGMQLQPEQSYWLQQARFMLVPRQSVVLTARLQGAALVDAQGGNRSGEVAHSPES